MHRRRGDDEALKLGVDSFRESRRQALIEARLREMDVRDVACSAKKPSAVPHWTTTPSAWPNWNCSVASRAVSASRNWNASRAAPKPSATAARPSASRQAWPRSSWG
jgi:hypothetical protein